VNLMLDPTLCHEVGVALGSTSWLVVGGFANGNEIRHTTTIPTTSLAFTRFHAAFVSSRTDWVAAGWLSEGHVGMILPDLPPDLDVTIQSAMARFAFVDRYVSNEIQINAVVAAVRCDSAPSVDGLLEIVRDEISARGGPSNTDTPRFELIGACRDEGWEEIVASRRAASQVLGSHSTEAPGSD
jgi:hypothetical protein